MLKSFVELIVEAAQGSKIANMSPEQHKRFRQNEAEASDWHKAHPIHHNNIINHFNQATPEERHQGMNWYKDAHHTSNALAKDTNTPKHTMAGLIANYSPQTHWHTNILTAARVGREKKAVGGPGSGVFASNQQKNTAHRMLNGEHYDNVLVGQKVKAFAHLIEHGEQKDPQKPRVVVDRHAYSVAAGARVNDAAFQQTGLKGKKKYQEVSHAYHEAAKHLSAQHGIDIQPHQVQAATWLVRQRLNQAEDKGKTAKVARTRKSNWQAYAQEHHPHLLGKEPGTGYSSN